VGAVAVAAGCGQGATHDAAGWQRPKQKPQVAATGMLNTPAPTNRFKMLKQV
jgi:hypothetical protein